MTKLVRKLFVVTVITGGCCVLRAQNLNVAENPFDADEVLALYPGVAPGSESWNWKEVLSPPPFGGRGGRLIRNVVQPTLTVFYPPNAKTNTHTAVIVAPGGGFRWLSIDSEGYEVARHLAAHGITGIVLKYRLDHTPEDEKAFRDDALAFTKSVTQQMNVKSSEASKLPPLDTFAEAKPGRKDGAEAIAYVRSNAQKLNVDPHRIGIIGFSAGGIVTHYALTNYDAHTRPDFAAEIYAGGSNVTWKDDTPPVFLAAASDDPVAAEWCIKTFHSLRDAKKSVELHVFASGGHGFGMEELGLTTDLWINEYETWLASLGYLTPQ